MPDIYKALIIGATPFIPIYRARGFVQIAIALLDP